MNDAIKQHPDSKCCRYCKEFVMKDEYRSHFRQNHRIRRCGTCDKSFFNAHQLERHLKIHEGEYLCDICKRKLSSKRTLTNHMLSLHLNKASRSKCEYCGKFFIWSSLRNHILSIHKNQRKYKCDVCAKGFFNCDKLRRHLAAVHLTERNHICTICSRKFTHKWHLTRHYKTVHVHKPTFKCEKCDRSFRQAERFRAHLKEHKKRPFLCTGPTCRSMFATEEARDKHKCVVAFQCDKCHKKYTALHNLDIHLISKHLGLRYECHFCRELYVTKLTIKHHLFKCHVDKV